MPRFPGLFALFLVAGPALASVPLPKPLVSGLSNPESVAVAQDGRVFISVIGEFGKEGDGAVLVLKDGKAVPFTTGLDDPKGLVAWNQWLFVTDRDRVLRIDRAGKMSEYVGAKDFPSPPKFLNDVEVDIETGTLYVSDSGDLKGKEGAIYRIAAPTRPTARPQVSLVLDGKKSPAVQTPNGLRMDGQSHLLLLDFHSGELHRIKLTNGTTEKLAEGFAGGDGLAWDYHGRLFISNWKTGKVHVIPRPGEKPVLLAEGLKSAADLCYDPHGKRLLVPDMQAGTLLALPATVPGQEVDETPLKLEPALAFPELKFAGWKPADDRGRPTPLRPLVLTHAGDGSNRVFVAEQRGSVHVFPNDPKAQQTKVFLNIESRVFYSDQENEQGLLGLTFHPQYRKNGEFFVFYSDRKARAEKKYVSILSRFRVSKDDPDRADPESEEVLLRIDRPFWNHDGGTILFGPDGFLYVALGDGGAANDPFGHAQNLKSLLGKVLRLDVDRKGEGKPYAIPRDNPFVDRSDVLPEIWCYGLRNIWRMAFDRPTGQLWAGEVGQNLYEEINILAKGGNFGWNPRESLHPFGARGVGVRKDMIEPIWEYHHDIGKSITGGFVYRGKELPEIEGYYLYGDYVSNRLWALKYDQTQKRVVANRPIRDQGIPVLSFGEDEKGEAYFLVASPAGKGIHRFVRAR